MNITPITTVYGRYIYSILSMAWFINELITGVLRAVITVLEGIFAPPAGAKIYNVDCV